MDLLHAMWTVCNKAQIQVRNWVRLETDADEQVLFKVETRELTYRARLVFIKNYPT